MVLLWRRNSCGRWKPLAMRMPTPSACVPIWISFSRSTRYNILKETRLSCLPHLVLRQHQLLLLLISLFDSFLLYVYSLVMLRATPKRKTTEPDSRSSFQNRLAAGGHWGIQDADISLVPPPINWSVQPRLPLRANSGTVKDYCLRFSLSLLFIVIVVKFRFVVGDRFVHLAARPQVNLRSMGRRRFAHLSDAGDEIYVDANIPWGSTTLFTLEFRDDSRLYAVHTANNRYLSRDGRLLEQCTATCLFSLEYHAGALALRDTQGLYLAPLGSKVCIHFFSLFYLYASKSIAIDFCCCTP